MTPTPPPPGVLADIDQWAKHVGDHLDALVTATRLVIEEYGPEPAAAISARVADLNISSKAKVAALLGVALVRLAQQSPSEVEQP